MNSQADDPNVGGVGTDAINQRILKLYPDQENPLQATAMVKYWSGGPDPLDFISMLFNKGKANEGIPAHWHYISFGFSDLHGDGRVHKTTGPGEESGFGFELSIRLKANEDEDTPPMWPATLLNSLARYVFKTGNNLNIGDHIPWKQSIAPIEHPDSCIEHMLIAEDPQLQTLDTKHGYFQFRQVVGVTEREMKAAQQWKGGSVLAMLAKIPDVGPLLVTDMYRQLSLFDYQPQLKQVLASSIDKDGSNLGHVTSVCGWEEAKGRGTTIVGGEAVLDSVHITFDANCIEIVPLIAKGRLLKGQYFIFQNIQGQVIVFIPPEFSGEMVTVDEETPLRAQGKALQIFCPKDFIIQLIRKCEVFLDPVTLLNLPRSLEFQFPKVSLTVIPPVLSATTDS